MEETRKIKLSERTADRLYEMIVDEGRYAPGSKLPNENELSVDLTVLAGLRSRVRAKDLFEMRLIFEPATVALACQRASDEELEMIRKKAERVERVAAEGGDWPLADQEFHWAIIKASHNEYMRRLYPIINSAVNEIMQISQNRQHMQDTALGDNRTILEFLLQRDEAGSRHAMSIHIRHLMNILRS